MKKLNVTVVDVDGVQCISIPTAKFNPHRFNDDAYFCLDAVKTPNSQFGKSHFIKTVAPKGTPVEQVGEFTAIIGNGRTFENAQQNQNQNQSDNGFEQLLQNQSNDQQSGNIDFSHL